MASKHIDCQHLLARVWLLVLSCLSLRLGDWNGRDYPKGLCQVYNNSFLFFSYHPPLPFSCCLLFNALLVFSLCSCLPSFICFFAPLSLHSFLFHNLTLLCSSPLQGELYFMATGAPSSTARAGVIYKIVDPSRWQMNKDRTLHTLLFRLVSFYN